MNGLCWPPAPSGFTCTTAKSPGHHQARPEPKTMVATFCLLTQLGERRCVNSEISANAENNIIVLPARDGVAIQSVDVSVFTISDATLAFQSHNKRRDATSTLSCHCFHFGWGFSPPRTPTISILKFEVAEGIILPLLPHGLRNFCRLWSTGNIKNQRTSNPDQLCRQWMTSTIHLKIF